MASKLLKHESTTVVEGLYRLNGRPISTTRTNVITSATADAVFSRPRPSCLTTTAMLILERWRNDKVVRSEPVNGIYREGTVAFVYGSDPTIKFDSGSGEDALLRARHKMAGSEFNFGETLVEFGDTVRLLTTTLDRLYRGFSALKNGNLGRAANLLGHKPPKGVIERLPPSKRLAKGYLEYQFGWVPLLGDVHNAVKVYTDGLSKTGDTVSKRSGRRFKGPVSSDIVGSVEARATVRGVVKNQMIRNFNELGLLNPALMAWNKLPFSFIVDWFLPISTILGAATASAGLSCYDQSILRIYGSVTPTKGGDARSDTYWARSRKVGVMSWRPARAVSLSLGQATSLMALLRALN